MELLKDPITLLTIINTIGLAGGTFYFYKQGETFQVSLNATEQTVKKCVKMNSELDKKCEINTEGLRMLKEEIKEIQEKIRDLPTIDNIRMLDDDLEEIVEILNENNIDVVRPSQRYRSGDRRDNRQIVREIEQDRSFRQVQSGRRQQASRDEMSFRNRRPYRDNRDDHQSRSELSSRVQESKDTKEDEIDALIEGTRKQTHC